MKKIVLVLFVIAAFMAACSSGANSTSTVTARSKYPGILEQAKKDKWPMMMHSGVNRYAINSVELDKDKQQMTVQLQPADSALQAAGAGSPSSLLHVYLTDSTSYTLDEPHTIPLEKVARMERVK